MIRDEQASIFTPDTARDDRIAVGPAARPMSRPVASQRAARLLATQGLTRLTRRPGLDPPVRALYTSGRANLLGAAWLAS